MKELEREQDKVNACDAEIQRLREEAESARADASAQRRTYETSREWLEWSAANGADGTVAGHLCQVASLALEPCL